MSESRSANARPLRPTKGTAVALDLGLRPGQALRLVAANCAAHFSANAPGIDGPRPVEFLHQARVALRRLRSALRTVRPPEPEVTRLRAEAKWLAGEQGEARDWDVFIESLRAAAKDARDTGEGRELARLVAAACRARDPLRKRAREAMRCERFDAFIADLARWTASPCPPAFGEPALPEFAADELRRRHRHLLKHKDALAQGTPEERHALRVAAKRLRYVADHFGPLLDAKASKRYLRDLESLQEALGLLNDLANAERLLASLPAAPAATRRFLESRRSGERKWLAAARAAMKRLDAGAGFRGR